MNGRHHQSFKIIFKFLTPFDSKNYPVLFLATINSFCAVLCDLLILNSMNKMPIILEFLHAIFPNFLTFFSKIFHLLLVNKL